MKMIENNFIHICILAMKYHNDYNKENYLITYKNFTFDADLYDLYYK